MELSLQFRPAVGFRNAFADIAEHAHKVPVTLEDGTHTFESESFPLGTLHSFEGRRILGKVSFRYTYDEEDQVVTVAGSDFASSDTMRLITAPEGTSEHCSQSSAGAGFRNEDLLGNPHWNYCTPLTPGLEDVLQGMARAANESLISALRDVPGLTVRVREHPPQLPPDDYLGLLVVYRDGVFSGLYSEGQEYGENDVVTPIESVWGGTVTFSLAEPFANVIGSTNDPKIDGEAWIRLWEGEFGPAAICTSYQFQGFNCDNFLVGGHVIEGKAAKKMPKGSNSVYIFPICRNHNNNDSVYMAALMYLQGIWLKNYLGT